MGFSALRRRLVLGAVAVTLSTGLISNSFADEGLLKKVKDRGTLIVGLEGTYPPFSFQGEDGKLTGFEVEFADALAQHMGVKAKLQPTKWDGMLASLESKRIDVVINQVTISPEREKKYDFSTPYTVSGIQALVKKGAEGSITKPEDLKGKKVGVGLGTNYEQWLRANVPGVDVRTYDDDPTKYQDLRVGRINAILVDRLAALDLVKKTGDTLAVAGAPFSRQESGVAIRKDNPELLAAINKAIAQMQQGETVWFGCDVGQVSNRKAGLLTLDAYDFETALDIKFTQDKASRLDYAESLMTHAMVLTGVDLDDAGQSKKWKIENSWGKDAGEFDGYFVASDEWMDEFTYQIVVRKEFLTPQELQAYEAKPKVLLPWDPMGALAI